MSQTILYPPPSPGAAPRPGTPAPPATSRQVPTTAWLAPLLAILLLAAGGLGYAWLRGRSQPPESEGVTLGRAFTPLLSASLADGFDAAAGLIEQGKGIKESDDALKAAFLKSREEAFKDHAAAAFAAIVPFDTEPKDDAARKAYAGLFRDFARGLRGTR